MPKKLTNEETTAVMYAAGLKPLEEYTSNKLPWRCECLTCGQTVTPSYNTIQRGKGGCVYCAGKVVDGDEAVAVMRAAGLEPLEEFTSSHAKWKCECLTCGEIVEPRYASVNQGNGGCIFCSASGFDYSAS